MLRVWANHLRQVGVGKSDETCEFAINYLLTGRGDAKQLAVTLAKRAPHRPVLEVAFVLSLAAASLEEVFASEEVALAAADAWRVAALLGVDLHMMQKRGVPHGDCGALLQYWQSVDGYFLS
jgi:hypothetical protein